eukprot:GHVN01010653.1.p1 GENE.GHVN01010653.1~~GHVN01010653.1.p1  ORF type:complete len:842 (+),score=157.70 GHVN01010653.1:76-2526(+)
MAMVGDGSPQGRTQAAPDRQNSKGALGGFGEKFLRGISKASSAFQSGVTTCDDRRGSSGIGQKLGAHEVRVGAEQPYGSPGSPSSKGVIGGSSDEPGCGEVWGNFNYAFVFKWAPTGSGGAGRLTAKATRHGGQQEIPIKCRWRRRVGATLIEITSVQGSVYHLSADDIGAHIMVEASPVARESGLEGVAFSELGPFDMDPSIRQSLDNYLGGVGGSGTRFPVRMIGLEDSMATTENDDLMLLVGTEEVKVTKPGHMNVGFTREWVGYYGGTYPEIQIHSTSPQMFDMILSDDPSDRLQLCAMTRNQRDLIALTLRCFRGRQHIATSVLLEYVARGIAVPEDPNAAAANGSMVTLDNYILVERLNAELNKALDNQTKAMSERDRAMSEKDSLEKEINATIEAYQSLLIQQASSEAHNPSNSKTSMGDPLSTSAQSAFDVTKRAAQISELETRVREAETEKSKYLEELELLRRDYRSLQNRMTHQLNNGGQSPTGTSSLNNSNLNDTRERSYMTQIAQLTKQVEIERRKNVEMSDREKSSQAFVTQLSHELERARAQSATTSPQMESTKDQLQIQMDEAQRLAKELDQVTMLKEKSDERVVQLDTDNRELTENFLYVKSKLDALEAQQRGESSAMSHEAEVYRSRISTLENDLDRLKLKEENAMAERTRLSRKNESLSRDLDKSRAALDSTTQKLNETKERLLQDKRKIEDEFTEVSRLYESQSSRLRSLAASPTIQPSSAPEVPVGGGGRVGPSSYTFGSGSDGVSGSGLAEDDELSLLESRIRQAHVEIEKLQGENQTLRSRIRKLAPVADGGAG